MPTVRQHHVVAGLRATVEANHRVGLPFAREVIDEAALAAIAEAQPQQRDVARAHAASVSPSRPHQPNSRFHQELRVVPAAVPPVWTRRGAFGSSTAA